MAKRAVTLIGIAFVLVGILGFVPGITTDGDPKELLGIFTVTPANNVVHLLSGIVALVAAGSSEAYARLYAKIFGSVYALVTIIGFIGGGNNYQVLGFINVNQADNFLHLALAAVILYIGFADESTPRRQPAA